MPSRRHSKNVLRFLFGLAAGIALLWLVFRDTEWRRVGAAIAEANLWWLAGMMLPLLASFFIRVQRWSYIVRAAGPATFRSMFSATQVGLLANFIIPLRVGELVRAYLLGRLAGIPFSKCLALATLDRVTDLAGLLVVFIVAIIGFPITQGIVIPGRFAGTQEPIQISAGLIEAGAISIAAVSALLIAVLVLLFLNQRLALRLNDAAVGAVSHKLAQHTHRLLASFAGGLQVFRSGADMAKAVVCSLGVWACFILSIAALLEAFNLEWHWYTPFVLQSLLAVLLSMPLAPGMVGQFHIAIVAALAVSFPAVTEDPDAIATFQAVAIMAHLLNLLPVALVGVYSLLREHMGLLELSRQSLDAEAGLTREAPPEDAAPPTDAG